MGLIKPAGTSWPYVVDSILKLLVWAHDSATRDIEEGTCHRICICRSQTFDPTPIEQAAGRSAEAMVQTFLSLLRDSDQAYTGGGGSPDRMEPQESWASRHRGAQGELRGNLASPCCFPRLPCDGRQESHLSVAPYDAQTLNDSPCWERDGLVDLR